MKIILTAILFVFSYSTGICFGQVQEKQEKYLKKRNEFDKVIYSAINSGLYTLEEKTFLRKVDSIFLYIINEFSRLSNEPGIHDEFLYFEEERIKLSKASLLTHYTLNIPGNLKRGKKVIQIESEYFNFLKDLNLNDSSLLDMLWFKRFTQKYIQKKAEDIISSSELFKYGNNIFSNLKFDIILDSFSDIKVRDFQIYALLHYHVYINGIQNSEKLLNRFKEKCSNQKYIDEIQKIYNRKALILSDLEKQAYKKNENIELELYVKKPKGWSKGDNRPAFVFFHGGGWNTGGIEEGFWFKICDYFTEKGFVAMSVQYRIKECHNSTPIESISDAKSAIRWVRRNASLLGVNPDKIIASGISAGGHLASSTGLIDDYDEQNEYLSVSSKPNAIVAWSPCLNPYEDAWFKYLLNDSVNVKNCSPFHNIKKGCVPIFIVHGTSDNIVPYWTIKKFENVSIKYGNDIKLVTLIEEGHFFFENEKLKMSALEASYEFLKKHLVQCK